MATKLVIGDKVKLTGKFLRNTGQFTGPEGLSTWTIVRCDCELCASGDYVAVDERGAYDPERQRHFNAANLFKSGTLDSRNSP